MEALLKFIESRTTVSFELRNEILNAFTVVDVQKNDVILREGMVVNKLYFLLDGTVRSYYYREDKDITSWIYGEHQFFTAWSGFINQEASFEYIQSTTDGQLAWISRQRYTELMTQHPTFEKFGRILLEEQLAFLDYFYKGFLFMSAREKYELLVSTFPEVHQNINLGHIASLLGISQETLSRIRGKK